MFTVAVHVDDVKFMFKILDFCYEKTHERYTNVDLKISLYVCVHIKTIPWKFCFLNPKNSQFISP